MLDLTRRFQNRASSVLRALGSSRTPSLLVALFYMGCASPPPPSYPVRLLDSFSEEGLALSHVIQSQETIDFSTLTTLDDTLLAAGSQVTLEKSGLHVRPTGSDPRLVFRRARRANLVDVEILSPSDGTLAVFWKSGRQNFEPTRVETISIVADREFRNYRLDLTKGISPDSSANTFRIDPIDSEDPVIIRAVTFSYGVPVPAGDGPLLVRKVALDREFRHALVLRTPTRFEKPIDPGSPRQLAFGLGRLHGSPQPVQFRVSLRSGERTVVLLEKTLSASSTSWADRRVDVPACSQDCELIFESLSEEGHDRTAAALFLSNPMIVPEQAPAAPNVILISVDTLGARHIPPALIAGASSLSRMFQEGVIFSNAISTSSLTHSSHGSLLTGLPPFDTDYYWLDGGVIAPTLSDFLRRRGYVTAAFTAGVLVSRSVALDKGFETFYQHDTLYRPPQEHSDIEAILNRATDWVSGHKNVPLFLFVHSYEVHAPYVDRSSTSPLYERYLLPTHMKGLLPIGPEELPTLVRTLTPQDKILSFAAAGIDFPGVSRMEKAHASEIDFAIGKLEGFLDQLGALGVLDDAVVVFTSDHGEAFFEHGLLEHGLLYQENLHIPLVVWAPRRLPGPKVIEDFVSLADLAPTILDLLDVKASADMGDRSLRTLAESDHHSRNTFYSFVLGEGLSCYTSAGEKLTLYSALEQENFGRRELFDLRTDPHEQNELLLQGIAVPRELLRVMERAIAAMPGVHIDLGSYAGRQYLTELTMSQPVSNNVYLFNATRSSGPQLDGPYSVAGTLNFLERPQLVIRSKTLYLDLSLVLRSSDDTERHEYRINTETTSDRSRLLSPLSGIGPMVRVWTVDTTGAAPGGFSPEEEERLRTLGYLQ